LTRSDPLKGSLEEWAVATEGEEMANVRIDQPLDLPLSEARGQNPSKYRGEIAGLAERLTPFPPHVVPRDFA
jgi:hypothetical protein